MADLPHPYQDSITQDIAASGFPVSQDTYCGTLLSSFEQKWIGNGHCCTRILAITKVGHDDRALTANRGTGFSAFDARTVAVISICKIAFEIFPPSYAKSWARAVRT